MENMNRGRNLINEKKEEKEERDVPLYCSITVACKRIQSSAGSRKINSP